MDSTERIVAAIERLFASFSGRTPDDATRASYYTELAPLGADAVEIGVRKAILGTIGGHVPTVAEMVGWCGGASPAMRAYDAYDCLLQSFSAVGSYQRPEFEDAALQWAVLALGGWRHLCDGNPDERKFWQPRFMQAYASAAARREEPPVLDGLGPDRKLVRCPYLSDGQRRALPAPDRRGILPPADDDTRSGPTTLGAALPQPGE